MTDLVLNLSQSSPCSSLLCSLFTYCVTNHDLKMQTFICDKILTEFKKASDGGIIVKSGNTTLNQLLLLVSGLLNDFTSDAKASLTGTLCGICLDLEEDEIRRPYCALLLQTTKTSSSHMNYMAGLSSRDVDVIFMLWNVLSQVYSKGSKDSVFNPLLLKLEDLMATMVADSEIYCVHAATVIKCIQVKGIDNVVELAYNNLVYDELDTKYCSPSKSRFRFLESLMIYDASLFSSKIVTRAMAKVSKCDEFGFNDEIIAVSIREVLQQNHCPIQDWHDTTTTAVIDRLCLILQHLVRNAIGRRITKYLILLVH